MSGSTEEREKRRELNKEKPAKEIKLADLTIYTRNDDFLEWWKKFKFSIQMCGLKNNTNQVQYSFIQHMDPMIKEYLQRITLDDELRLEDMIVVVLSLHDKGSKTPLDLQK